MAVLRRHFWLLKFLAATCVIYFVASATSTYIVTQLAVVTVDAVADGLDSAVEGDDPDEEGAEPARKSARDKSQLAKTITENNPFCPECVGHSAPPPATPDALPQSTSSLELVATMLSSAPGYSLATIADREHGTVGLFGPQDSIRGGVVLEVINQGRVVIVAGGRREVLQLGARGTKPPPPPPPGGNTGAPPPLAPTRSSAMATTTAPSSVHSWTS